MIPIYIPPKFTPTESAAIDPKAVRRWWLQIWSLNALVIWTWVAARICEYVFYE